MDLRFEGGFGQRESLHGQGVQGVADLLRLGDHLLAVERTGGALRSYDLADLNPQSLRSHVGAGPVSVPAQGAAVTLGGDPYLLLSDGAQLIRHRLEPGGAIGAGEVWSLPGQSGGFHALHSFTDAAGQGFLFGAGPGGIWGWRLEADGRAQALARTGDSSAFAGTGVTALSTVRVAGQPVLLAADQGGAGETGSLRSFRIDPGSGALLPAAVLGADDGLGVSAPGVVEGFVAYGRAWAVLGAAGSDSLSVVEVGADGGLNLRDHLLDSLASRFEAVSALKVITVDDHVFVLVGGGDGGLDLLRLLPTGQLVQAAQILQAPGRGLQNITAIEALARGDHLEIFVASEQGLDAEGEGLAHLRLSRSDLGLVLTSGGGVLAGSAGDDLLMGTSGAASTIRGGAGDDMLVMGAPGDRLEGGAGADRFVARTGLQAQGAGRVVIADFEGARDQLDLSLLTGLRSLSQLVVSPRHDGIDLSWQGLEIRVLSRDGNPLTLTDLWPLGWDRAHHLPGGETLPPHDVPLPPDPTPPPDPDQNIDPPPAPEPDPDPDPVPPPDPVIPGVTRMGGSGHDRLTGGGGADLLEGGGGRDTLRGDAGADRLIGGAGADLLLGGLGDDWLAGQRGADRLEGGDGADRLAGAGGADSLFGDAGADHLLGGAGDDLLEGGSGDDLLEGGTGENTLRGGSGRDVLLGGDTGDSLWGNAGEDQLWGGNGHDRIRGGGGADRLEGEAGDDLLWGGAGRDLLRGDAGADVLLGQKGHDTLYGGAGDDRLSGNPGWDVLYGGSGADQIWGHGGRDQIWGEAEDDQIWGGNGHDRMRGGHGNDSLDGGRHADVLEGQQGDDLLVGGAGHDTLWGGLGADVFVFGAGHGRDRVMDFTPGTDLIDLRGLGPNGAQQFSDLAISRTSGDLYIRSGQGVMVLEDLRRSDLNADDFLF